MRGGGDGESRWVWVGVWMWVCGCGWVGGWVGRWVGGCVDVGGWVGGWVGGGGHAQLARPCAPSTVELPRADPPPHGPTFGGVAEVQAVDAATGFNRRVTEGKLAAKLVAKKCGVPGWAGIQTLLDLEVRTRVTTCNSVPPLSSLGIGGAMALLAATHLPRGWRRACARPARLRACSGWGCCGCWFRLRRVPQPSPFSRALCRWERACVCVCDVCV